MDIFYRLKSPTDLADLNDSFSHSFCKGLYLFLNNIKLSNNKTIFNKKSITYLKTIKSLKKEIILTFDFNKKFSRPDYHSPRLNSLAISRLEEKLDKGISTKKDVEKEKEFLNSILKKKPRKNNRIKKTGK